MILRLHLLFLLPFVLCFNPVTAQDAREIIRRSEENVRGVKSSQSEMTISIVRPKWSREIGLKTWTKGDEYSLILITSPAKEKGNAFLKRDKEVWNWVPSIERTIKMPPSMMLQSWMGTDFTNDDLVRESSVIEDYTHRLMGEEIIDGKPCYKIEMIPRPDAPVVWGKLIVWIDKKNYIQLQAEMYDEDGFLVNRLHARNIRQMDDRLIATQLELIPQDKPGHKTMMQINSIQFDQPLNEDFFTIQNMRRLQ